MKLKEITPFYVGPFKNGITIPIEAGCTVVTGRNDVGKSKLLRLIEMACNHSGELGLGERDVAFDRLASSQTEWESDPEIRVQLKLSAMHKNQNAIASAEVFLAPKVVNRSHMTLPNYQGHLDSGRLPRTVRIQPARSEFSIRQNIYMKDPNAIEALLLGVAFGKQFDYRGLLNISERC